MKKNCLNCGKEINVKPSQFERKKYCSRICKTEYQKSNPPQIWSEMSKKILIPCSYCKQQILRKPSNINKTNFCNINCKKLYQIQNGHLFNQHLRKDVEVKCLTCHQMFIVPKNREHTAKFCSKECLGKANGIRGKEQYRNRIIVSCSNCHKKFEKTPSTIRKLNFCTVACMSTYYAEKEMFAGANSGTWTGGKVSYYGPNWYSQRRKVRARDEYTCQDCGITEAEYGQELSVHHIIPFKQFNGDWKKANQLSNLISLCEFPCHRKRHSRMVDDIV